MGQTSITMPIGDVNVNADVNYQKVKEGSLFPKQRIVHRTPAGKRCVQVNSTVLEGSGKRILFHSTEKVYIDEDGQMIPSGDVVDWLIEDDGTESQVNKFEQNMKKGAGVGVDTRVPRDMLRGFVIGDIYEIITEDEQQKWNLWQLAKDLWDNNEIGIIKEVVLSTGYTVRAGLLVPFVNEEEGYFYLELQLTTKKREPNGMTIPTSKPGPGPAPTKDDKKREHVGDILANPIGDNPSTHFTIEEAEPWVDGTYVPPGEYPIIDTTEGTVVIRADTYDDREGNLLHARNQQVTIVTQPELYTDEYEGISYGEPEFSDHHYWKNNPTDLNELSRDDFIKELIDMELPYGDVQGLVMSYVITNNLGSNEEDEILKHYHRKSQEHLTKQSTLFNPTGVPNTIYRQLGGGRFVAMTGAKDFIADENTLIFKLRRGSAKNGINIVRITLNSMDLYDIKFQKYNYKTYDITDIKEYNNIYADQLKEIFEETTGLYTSLRNNPSDIDDYVEDISTRYHAGRYADVLRLWREFSKDHTPQETIQLYSMLRRKGVTLSIGDLKRKMDRKSNPKRPPSEFWDEIYPDILKDYKKKFPTEKAKEIARKVVGDIWYNKMDSSSRKKYLRKEVKSNPKTDLYEQEFKCPECTGLSTSLRNPPPPKVGDVVKIDGKNYTVTYEFNSGKNELKKPYKVRLEQRGKVDYFTSYDRDTGRWGALISLGNNPPPYHIKSKGNGIWDVVDSDGKVILEGESYTVASNVEYGLNHPDHWEPSETCEVVEDIRNSKNLIKNPDEAVRFDCPECGSPVTYEAHVVPASWDEPGYVENEWISQRDCDKNCSMTEQDLIDYAQDLDGGNWYDPSEPDPDRAWDERFENPNNPKMVCPHCGEEVSSRDESYWCDSCGVQVEPIREAEYLLNFGLKTI